MQCSLQAETVSREIAAAQVGDPVLRPGGFREDKSLQTSTKRSSMFWGHSGRVGVQNPLPLELGARNTRIRHDRMLESVRTAFMVSPQRSGTSACSSWSRLRAKSAQSNARK